MAYLIFIADNLYTILPDVPHTAWILICLVTSAFKSGVRVRPGVDRVLHDWRAARCPTRLSARDPARRIGDALTLTLNLTLNLTLIGFPVEGSSRATPTATPSTMD